MNAPPRSLARIVAATDLSDPAEELLEHARLVAPDAHWVLCNMFQVPFA